MKMFEPGCGFWYNGFSYCTTEARIFSRRARHFVHFVHFSQIRASAASRSEQQSSMGPAVVGCHRQFPARTLLCGGADVLACTIRFSPEIEATRNGWCAWARCGRGCHGRNPCGLGSIKPAGRGVRAQRCGHLVLFEQRAVQDLGVAPMFWTCPGTKEATSISRQRQHLRPSRKPPTMGVYVACVPVRRACLCTCRFLPRGQHDAE